MGKALDFLLPWDEQPQGAAAINWENPLTRSLKVLVNGGAGATNLVNQSHLAATSITDSVSRGGRGFGYSGGSGSLRVPHNAEFNATSGWTIFALVISRDAAGVQYVLNRNYDGSKVPASLSIGGLAATNGAAYFDGAVWRKSGITTAIAGDNKLHTVVGTFGRVGGTALDYYVDGKLDASGAGAASPPTGTGDMYVGRYQNDAASFRGDILICGYSTRAWDAFEIAAFGANPWQLFEPQRMPIPVAAGGGVPAESGGSSAPVTVTGAGAGSATEGASGGSSASVAVTSAGAGTAAESASGGAGATVTVSAAGAGAAADGATGGSSALVAVTAAGAGAATEAASSGASASVSVSAAGFGAAVESASGGASASVSVSAVGAGAGADGQSGGASATVTTTAAGAGTATEQASGGSISTVLVTAVGGSAAPTEAAVPANRTLRIAAESRVLLIAAEQRSVSVAHENRTLRIPS